MMTSSPKPDAAQLRKVAILVATLDERLADRLLADLPARDAAAVEQLVAQLGDIDPAEYRAVVDDFQRGLATPPKTPTRPTSQPTLRPHREQTHGVELDESLLARLEAEEPYEALPLSAQSIGPWQAVSETDAHALVEMLSAEQPQTIAVVFSRLDPQQAAALMGKLSPALQTDVFTRLADLDPADEQTLHVVESQLASWIEQQRQRRQRMAAGRDLVQRILHATPDAERATMLTRLGRRDRALVESLSTQTMVPPEPVVHSEVVRDRVEVEVAVETAARRSSPAVEAVVATPPALERKDVADPLGALESLDDQALLLALQSAERETVLLALAGASEMLMKRIVHGLPRRSAKQFRQQVRSIGPARLSDMTAAQRELLRCSQSQAN